MTQRQFEASQGFLPGVRVLEVADELGEYCGKVLAGLGADVIKIEPPEGNPTRRYGPFYQDQPHPERSLYFWHYNFGKRGITLNLDSPQDQELFKELVKRADVVLNTRPRGYLEDRGLGYEALKTLNPAIVVARISPFGDTGPWADYKASDLVHLALGGMMSCSGYDPEPSGFYDLPPIAPQMWHAYHVAGEMTVIAIIQSLYYRNTTGVGQYLSTAVHDAISKNTETDFHAWVYTRTPLFRQTARHAQARIMPPTIALTKDGRYVMGLGGGGGDSEGFARLVEFLDAYSMADDLKDEKYQDNAYRAKPEVGWHINDLMQRFMRRFRFEGKWQEAQERGMTWTPVRKPQENLTDPHWKKRETFFEVEHPELGKKFTYVGAKWLAPELPWRRVPRAPLLGEHNREVLGNLPKESARLLPEAPPQPRLSKHGKPFALSGLRMIDLTWMLASGGAGRFLASQGVEIIKIEWKTQLARQLRIGSSIVSPGGRAERDRATAPIVSPPTSSPNRSGFFNDVNPGKRGISLNMNNPKGKELFVRLVKMADIVAEGFSPGVMERWGFTYERLKEINPAIIYARQSGLGAVGTYGRFRSNGPTAASIAGLTEMSGLPEPYPPAGIGYSYLDWFGAYNLATALTAALYRRQITGKGCYIDSSQAETGTYLNGTAILDYSANSRPWQRYGNRSPYKPAAPHGAYRCQGNDRWIAIACFSPADWQGFLNVVGNPDWGHSPQFATLEARLAHQDELDALVNEATKDWEPFQLMHSLQKAGVPAGVCQTAEDRIDHDLQLKHLEWLTELPHSEIGTWPVKEFPVKFSETPAYMGGLIGRAAPCYGEDNEYVYGELLSLPTKEIKELEEQGVI